MLRSRFECLFSTTRLFSMTLLAGGGREGREDLPTRGRDAAGVGGGEGGLECRRVGTRAQRWETGF